MTFKISWPQHKYNKPLTDEAIRILKCRLQDMAFQACEAETYVISHNFPKNEAEYIMWNLTDSYVMNGGSDGFKIWLLIGENEDIVQNFYKMI